VPEKLLMMHGKRIQDGRPQRREEWHELVEAIEMMDANIHQIQWEDVKLWIEQQTDYDRHLSELHCL
jgi:hypothetical protein